MFSNRAVSILIAAAVCGATEYHVSANGKDGNTGAANSPLRTIQAAADRMVSGDQCVVHQGIYHENVRVKADNVKLTAVGTVIVSAADPVTGWSDHAGSIRKARISGSLGIADDQVFIRGKWYPQARWPNIDDWTMRNCGDRQRPNRCGDIEGIQATWYATAQNRTSIMAPTFVTGWMDNLREDPHNGWPTTEGICKIGISGFGKELSGPAANPYNIVFNKPRDHWKGALLYCFGWWWSASGYVSASYDGKNSFTGADATFFDVLTPRIRWPGSFVLIGHIDLIDQPGEWVVKDSLLYLWMPGGTDPESGDILLKRRHHTFDLSKRRNVEVKGFHSLGGQIQMDSASFCTMDDCHFYCLNHGWLVQYDATGGIVRDNEKAGRAGILFSGDNNTFRNGSVVYAAHSAFVMCGGNNRVIDSYISDINYVNTYSAPVLMQGTPKNSLITRSTFRRAGRSILGGFKSAVLTHSILDDAMMLSGDGGALYSVVGGLVRSDETEVAYNWFRGCYGEPSTYIYSDWGCALGMKVHNNVFFPTGSAGKFVPEATCGMFYYHNTWLAPVNGRDWLFETKDAIYRDSAWDKREWANNLNAAYNRSSWLFSDTTAGDYTVRQGSPSIDAGEVIPGFTETHGGYWGTAPDLGAYEYGRDPWVPGHTWGDPMLEEQLWSRARGLVSTAEARRMPNSVRIHPIRTAPGLRVTFSAPASAVAAVHNALGRIVLQRNCRESTGLDIGLSGLPNGSYSVRVMTATGEARTLRAIVTK